MLRKVYVHLARVRTSGRDTMNLSWRETQSGVVSPTERLSWGQSIAMGFQHVLAMFGATVVNPTGNDPMER
jgi:hypothetical protein